MLTETNSVLRADTETMPRMRWGAIIGGWLVATGIASMLYVAGLALGFSALDPNNPETVAKGIGMGAAAWMVLTWAVSLFLGGMFASWFDGRSDATMGALHGVTVWGLSVAASGLLVVLGLGQAVQGGASLAGGTVPQMQMQMTQQGAPVAMTPSGTVSQPVSRPDPAAKEAAKRYTAAAMWIAFVSTLLALIASGFGGWLGASHIHRVYHLRRYEVRPA